MSRKHQRKGSRAKRGHGDRRRGAGPGGPWPSRAKRRRWLHFSLGLAFVGLVLTALWWIASSGERAFTELARTGAGRLEARVVAVPSLGRGHDPGAGPYEDRFPTSGLHHPNWVEPGVYTRRQSPARLVHALEHGNIVIYYDQPGDEVLERLRAWARLYDDQWSGIVVTPARDLGQSLMLTAWTRRLQLEEFQPELAAAFIDAFRGRGPEHPVR